MQLIQQNIDKGNKSILKMEWEALSSSGPTKTNGKSVKGTSLKESLKNEKGREVLPSTKNKKIVQKQAVKE